MAKVLHIIANPNPEGYSVQAAVEFLKHYKEKNPDDEIISFNLYEQEMPFYDMVDFTTDYVKERKDLSEQEQKKLDYRYKLADEFLAADKYIISSPMWNFSVPAILKAYIDLIVVSGKTFTFETGEPKGLASGKALFVASRGGDYSQLPQYEHQNNYLKAIFGWLGITDQQELIMEAAMMNDGREERWQAVLDKAKELSENF